ncbi:MAG: hypothetical protein RLZZ306_3254 [Bacteroidota bacterium]|jgi:hypothetical protein
MNDFRTSLKKIQNIPASVFLNSIYYTLPFGMFLTACNFMFESVRNYYFDWMIVVLPTIAVYVIGNLYEMFVMYQESGLFVKRDNTFTSNQASYSISNNNLITT